MTKQNPQQPTEAAAERLLAAVLVDAYGEQEELTAIATWLEEELPAPVPADVLGQSVVLLRVRFEGNRRRGITAVCSLEDGAEHEVSLADVHISPRRAGHECLAAYRLWMGLAPTSGGKPAKRKRARGTRVEQQGMLSDLSQPIELIVLAAKHRSARCRLPRGEKLTLRTSGLEALVPGEVITVEPKKSWTLRGYPLLSGKVTDARINVAAIGLPPLGLDQFGDWDPRDEYWGEDEPLPSWARQIIAQGPRPFFKMQQVLPSFDPLGYDDDPIVKAAHLRALGDTQGARRMLLELLESELRCLDAHAHLGNLTFHQDPRVASKHYEVGYRIGEECLGKRFEGVLSWGLIDNRPFLRCMHGYGLALWRARRWEDASELFARMLWLNPSDNQGIRFLLDDVHARRKWEDCVE